MQPTNSLFCITSEFWAKKYYAKALGDPMIHSQKKVSFDVCYYMSWDGTCLNPIENAQNGQQKKGDVEVFIEVIWHRVRTNHNQIRWEQIHKDKHQASNHFSVLSDWGRKIKYCTSKQREKCCVGAEYTERYLGGHETMTNQANKNNRIEKQFESNMTMQFHLTYNLQ